MRRARIAIVVAIVACAPVRPVHAPPTPRARPSHIMALPGGTRLLVIEDRASPSVLVSLVVPAGSRHDPPGKEGLAHLVEHLSYRASVGGARRVDVVKRSGGDFNAWTREEDTQFVAVAPREALRTMLELEVSRLRDPLAGIDEKTLRVERNVVRNELRSRGLDAAAADLLKEMVFPLDHPYRHAGVTTSATLDASSLEDARAFAAARYRASGASITVCGNVDPAEVQATLASLLPPDGPPVQYEPVVSDEPPKPSERGLRRIQGPVVHPTLVLGWALPGGFDDDEVRLALLLPALRDAATALLTRERVESARCVASPGARVALALCAIELVEGEEPEEIAQKAVDGLYVLWSDQRAAEEWRRAEFGEARGEYAAELLRRSGSIRSVEAIARDFHHGADPDRVHRLFHAFEKAGDLQLQHFAYRWLTRARVVTFAVDPLPPDAPGAIVAVDPSYSWPGAIVEPGDDAPEEPEKIEALAKTPDLSGLVEATLSNGLHTIVVPRHGTGTVRVSIFARGGMADADPWGLPELAFPRFSARDPLSFGGVWTSARFPDAETFAIDAPASKLIHALDTLHERVRTTRSAWERSRFEKAIESIRRRTKAAERRPETAAWRSLWTAILGSHPLGSGGFDVVKLAPLERRDYDAWLARHLAPANMTLLVVGDVDPAVVREKLDGRWSKWRATNPGEPMPKLPPPPDPPTPRLFLAERRSGYQADLTLACQAGGDAASLEVLGALLREELWSELRESSGATYGVEVGVARHSTTSRDFAILTVRAQVQADRIPAAAKLLVDRVRAAAAVEPKRLARTKAVLARRTHVENLTAADLADSIALALRTGGTPADLATRPSRLARVTPESLAETLAPCVNHEIVTVVGPATLAEPLRNVGLPLR